MLTDEELCRQLQSGSEVALESLVHRYHGPIHGYIYRQVNDESTTDDLVQETFIRLCTRMGQYNYPQPFKPWLYRIALNLCRDYWKSAYFRQAQQSEELSSQQVDDNPSVESIYNWQETRQEVMAAINCLDEIYRDVLILRFYQDLKVSEIADVLEIPIGTAKWRLFQALKLMKDQLTTGGEAYVWTKESDD